MEEVPYGRILREGWVLIVVIALVGAVGAWAFTRLLPESYSATTTLMLQVDSSEASLFEQNQFSMARIKSYPVLVDAPEVIEGARSELGIDTEEYTDRELRQMLSAQITDDTVLLQIVAEAPDAALAKDLANSSAQHLSQLIGEMENAQSDVQYSVELVQVLPANEPTSPDSPQVLAITGLGAIGGLAVGAIAAVYRTTKNRRLLTISDVRRATGLPVVGQIPKVRKSATEFAATTLVPFQELIGNLPVLGGHGRDLFVLVPASGTVVDEDTLAGVLEAYDSKGVRACALDLRETEAAVEGTRPWSELLDQRESVSDPDRLETNSQRGVVFAADHVVSAKDLRSRIPAAVRALRSQCDVVIVLCDSESSSLQATLAGLGAAFVVGVRRRTTSATELVSVVTRLRLMDLFLIGVLMIQTPRSAQENLAESWRWTDGERVVTGDRARDSDEGEPRSPVEGQALAEVRGRRASS